MHDISLGVSIRDYLTGETIESTTYEDLRQALARLLVEEKGFVKERIKPRVPVRFPIEGRDYVRLLDFVVYGEDDSPLMAILFCAGDVRTYLREALAATRLIEGGPAPLTLVTDSKDATLLAAVDGTELGRGMAAVPSLERLREFALTHPRPLMTPEALERERRIAYAYGESLHSCCAHAACTIKGKGGGFQD